MAEQQDWSRVTAWDYTFRGLLGLIVGMILGAAAGALLLILIYGWGNFTRDLASNRPAGIMPGASTEARGTIAITLVFAFWGAVIGTPLGLIIGLISAWVKRT